MGRLLVTLATLMVLLLSAAFVAPLFVDWNSYKPDIERIASALLSRTITIHGPIQVALLPEPRLRAKEVVAEGSQSEAAQMTAEAVDLTLSLQALFSGRVEVSRLKLDHPFIVIDLSKPLQENAGPAKTSPLHLSAGLASLDVEGGRISVYADAAQPQALTFTNVDGTLLGPQNGSGYRFSGRATQEDRRFDVKFVAGTDRRGVKISGGLSEVRSKAQVQADGVLDMAGAPAFQGSLSVTAPAAFTGTPFEIQAKSTAKLDRKGLELSGLVVGLDGGGRPQNLTGSATIAFAPEALDLALEAPLVDMDALFSGRLSPTETPAEADGWDRFRAPFQEMLWLYPDFAAHVSLAIEQIQLRGDVVNGAKIDATRTGQRWLFEEAQAKLPGATELRMTGAFKKTALGKTELLSRVSLDGANFNRLSRWIASSSAAKNASARAFSIGGLFSHSDEATSLMDGKGSVNGAPFALTLRLDRDAPRKLTLSLQGDDLDLTGVEAPVTLTGLSSESAKAAWRTLFGWAVPILGDDAVNFDMADIAVTAGHLRTSLIEAKNVAVQVKYNQDGLSVTKLAAETFEGLSLRGEGIVPMRAGVQGRFGGRLEASSRQAVSKALALVGLDDESVAGRAEDLTPAILTVNYSADAQSGEATAQLGGSFGGTRLDSRLKLKGSLADWRAGRITGQATLAALDSSKLMAFLSLKAEPVASAPAPGTLTLSINGTQDRLETSAALKMPQIQAQIDGIAKLASGFSFSGKAQGVSSTPETILPLPLIALLGGEAQTPLKVEAKMAYEAGCLDLANLKAEAGKNTVSGHLAIGVGKHGTEIDADLKALSLSLPSILAHGLASPPPADRLTTALASALPSQDLWSERPFDLSVLRNTGAKVVLAAQTMRLSDTVALSDAQASLTLNESRLDVQNLDGKAFGGDFKASLSLDGHGAMVSASANLSLAKADIAKLANNGSPPILAGKGSLTLQASGQGLSPRGILAGLTGKGVIAFGDGQITKVSPARVQKLGDELAALPQPPAEDAMKKKVSDALQSADFKYRHLKSGVRIRDGMLDLPRASFRSRDGKDGTIRMQAYLDLSSMQADTTWQAGVSSDRPFKWPPVKVEIAGPLRELGARPRTLFVDDFTRAILLRKMEGDITRLETLSAPPAASAWATKQEGAPAQAQKGKRNAPPVITKGATEFEKRMRDALSKNPPRVEPQAQSQ